MFLQQGSGTYTMFRALPLCLGLVFLVCVGGCSPHGEKHTINGGEVYYKDGATKQEAEKLGDFLVKEGFFDGDRKSVQLTKDGKKYQLRIVVKPEYQNNPEIKWAMQVLAGKVGREVFDGADVELQMCDDQLKTIITDEGIDYGKLLTFNNGQLFYKNDVTQAEVEKLGNYLVKEGFFDGNVKSVQLVKKGDKYQFRMVVEKTQLAASEDTLKAFRKEISQGAFQGAYVELHACDDHFNTIKVFEPGIDTSF